MTLTILVKIGIVRVPYIFLFFNIVIIYMPYDSIRQQIERRHIKFMSPEFELFKRIIGYAKDAILDTNDDRWKKTHSEKQYTYSSSAKAASNLIAVFPVLCSSNTKLETSMMISKNIERRGATNLQMLLTAVNVTNAKDGFEYLRRFHQNINLGGSTAQDYADTVVKYVSSESANEFYMDAEQANRLVQLLKESYTQFYQDDYNHSSLNDFMVESNVDGYVVSIDPYKSVYHEADANNKAKNETGNDRKKWVELKDSDVKKANEAVPSLLVVRFTTVGEGNDSVVTEFIIGVKAKLVPTDYMEVLNKIYTNNRDGKGLINLIRATTGELSFFKDYVFAVDQAKDDIANMKKKGSKELIWKELEGRAVKAKQLIRQGKNNYASAVTTVVITSEDADFLYKEENIDIRNIKEARKFMQSYNLFCFVIVNDTEESAWFLYDEENPVFEKLSYTMLERESSDGNQYKKILNLIGKMK